MNSLPHRLKRTMFQPVFLRKKIDRKGITMKKARMCLAGSLFVAALLVGCGQEAPQDDKIIRIEQEEETPVEYVMGTAQITDVIATKGVRCSYQQVSDSGAAFQLNNRRVAAVYVKKGDEVEEGQLLAELDVDEELKQIKELDYKISRAKIELEFLKKNKASKIEEVKLQYQYYPAWEAVQDKSRDQAVWDIEAEYQYAIEDLEDTIAMDEERLADLNEIVAKNQLFAPRSGIVSYVKSGLVGSYIWSVDEPVINIMDTSICVFETKNIEYAKYFNKDTVATLNIASGNAKGTYELVPYDMIRWGETLRFASKEDNSIEATIGDNGTLYVTVGQKNDVLAVVKEAVHRADNKRFVYVVGEEGLREIKWIVTGMEGDSYIEVLEGLEEGEKVVVR